MIFSRQEGIQEWDKKAMHWFNRGSVFVSRCKFKTNTNTQYRGFFSWVPDCESGGFEESGNGVRRNPNRGGGEI